MSRRVEGNPAEAGRAAPPRVLCVAGSDSSGCAGVAADVRTVAALGCHALVAITAVTAQDARSLVAAAPVSPRLAGAQVETGLAAGAGAVKVGMLAGAAVARAVAGALERCGARNVVVDPVLRSTSGGVLLDEAGRRVLVSRLIPLATLVTPNLPEAAALTGLPVRGVAGMEAAARELVRLGARAVLVKGGHLRGAEAVDLFADASGTVFALRSPRLAARNTRGTGCVLSSAVAAHLALGHGLPAAVLAAKRFVVAAIAGGYPLGKQRGPADPTAAAGVVCR